MNATYLQKKIDYCSHSSNINIYCSDCEYFLCSDCKESHLDHNLSNYQRVFKYMYLDFESMVDNLLIFNSLDIIQINIKRFLDSKLNMLIESIKNQHEQVVKRILEWINVENNFKNEISGIQIFFDNLKNNFQHSDVFFANSEKVMLHLKQMKDIFDNKEYTIKAQEIQEKIKFFEKKKDIYEIPIIEDQMLKIFESLGKIDNCCNCKQVKIVTKCKLCFEEYCGNCRVLFICNNCPKNSILPISNETNFLFSEIRKQLNRKYKLSLLYRGSIDGFSSYDFHRKCDGKYPILIVVKNEFEKTFGGFVADTYFSSSSYSKNKASNRAFLFSYDRKYISNIKDSDNAIICSESYGPIFGSNMDLKIDSNPNTSTGSQTRPNGITYKLPDEIIYKFDEDSRNSFFSGSNKQGRFKVIDYEAWLCELK